MNLSSEFSKALIARIWHGYTTFENATVYENLLKEEVFPSIEKKKIKGYRKISLLKQIRENDVEFITIMLFDNLENIKDFVGEDYEQSYVPLKAQEVLLRHDERSKHYEIVNEIDYGC